MKKGSKMFVSILLVLMLVLQLSGCDQQNSSTSSKSGSSDVVSTSEESSALAEDTGETNYDEKLTISWAVYGDEFADLNSDDFAKMWNEKFNLEWDVISMSADTWAEKIRVWANALDLPDVAQWEYNHADAAGFVDQGLVKKLPDDW